MVGAEAEIKDKDERKPQIPKAWLHSAACWNLSSGKNFFIWGFVLIRLVWEGETADLSTLHSQTWGLLLLLSPVPRAQLVLVIPPPSLGQTGQGRAGLQSSSPPVPTRSRHPALVLSFTCCSPRLQQPPKSSQARLQTPNTPGFKSNHPRAGRKGPGPCRGSLGLSESRTECPGLPWGTGEPSTELTWQRPAFPMAKPTFHPNRAHLAELTLACLAEPTFFSG